MTQAIENANAIYKPRKSVMGGGLVVLAIVFFGLTLPLLVGGTPIETGRLYGLGMFWLLGILLTIVPFGFRLEVKDDHVRTSFLGFKIRDLHRSNIEAMKYGNIVPGGFGVGKGLRGWEKTPRGRKYFSIGESAYGKDAIEHVKRVLERAQT